MRAGQGGAAPPGVPRDAQALGAGNEEEAAGGSGGGAAGTRARRCPSGRGQPLSARPLGLPGRAESSRPASFLPATSGAPAAAAARWGLRARIHLPRPARRRSPAAGTRSRARPTRSCCSPTPAQPRRCGHAPVHLACHAAARTSPGHNRRGREPGDPPGRGGTDPVPPIGAGALRRRPLDPGTHPAAPDSRLRDWIEPPPSLPESRH